MYNMDNKYKPLVVVIKIDIDHNENPIEHNHDYIRMDYNNVDILVLVLNWFGMTLG